MLQHPILGATHMIGTDAATVSASAPHAADGMVADRTLLAELALTFDLDVLVAETERDPFRR